MENLLKYDMDIFDSVKHIDEEGNEYWYARELQKVLEYKEWRNFLKVLKVAMVACSNSENNIDNHFVELNKMVKIGSKAGRKIKDYKLSRYACYLIVQNADPSKEVIALGQTYFDIQTRKMEVLENEYNLLPEDERRLYIRSLTKKGNQKLNKTAIKCGVKNLDKFHNAGYKGLYNGETADDIAKRKNLRYREDILDNMGSTELAANLFRITQTEDKLIKDKVMGDRKSCEVHYNMGKNIRRFIKQQGGTMPEDLPKPSKSLKELKK